MIHDSWIVWTRSHAIQLRERYRCHNSHVLAWDGVHLCCLCHFSLHRSISLAYVSKTTVSRSPRHWILWCGKTDEMRRHHSALVHQLIEGMLTSVDHDGDLHKSGKKIRFNQKSIRLLMVEPTHLKNMLVKLGSSSPSRGENTKYLNPPARYYCWWFRNPKANHLGVVNKTL